MFKSGSKTKSAGNRFMLPGQMLKKKNPVKKMQKAVKGKMKLPFTPPGMEVESAAEDKMKGEERD